MGRTAGAWRASTPSACARLLRQDRGRALALLIDGVLAAELLLGNDLLPLLVLALGGALVVGNGMALIRPPAKPKPGELARAPRARTIAMLVLGLIAAVWALASLLAK